MNALLLAAQLVIPTIPADINEHNFISETIKTYACVEAVEEDGIVHTMDEETGSSTEVVRLIVTAKSQRLLAQCAEQLVAEIEGLKLEQTFSIIPAFVVSYEVPAGLLNNLKPVVDNQISTQVTAN